MAFKFYSKFSAADFQRYKDFFPNFETDNVTVHEGRRGGTNTATTTDLISQESGDRQLTSSNYACRHWKDVAGYFDSYDSTSASLSFPSSSPPLRPSSSLETLCSYWSSASDSTSCSSSPPASRSKSRKATCPKRSPRLNDPKFTGVTFSVETAIAGNKPILSTKLNIRPSFRIRRCRRLLSRRSALRWRRMSRDDHVSMSRRLDSESSSSGTDYDGETKTDVPSSFPTWTRCGARMTMSSALPSSTSHSSTSKVGNVTSSKCKGKQCESCKTRCTPLWRDAEDGTPLCNACGIRYKKYRIRCPVCWLIPRKDSKTFPRCARCSVLLKMCLPRRTQSIS
ncbi:uncharacterized protein [Diadema setosum]|uniref:uncharacterized protein n=1 Tax=Diadema setosum TaxID=31175 RepID=UPI003B3A2B1F